MSKTAIPIKNIYYMLSYYFEALNSDSYKKISGETFENIYELLTEILILGTRRQLKRGVDKGYKNMEETSSIIRGKIHIFRSLREGSITQKKLAISYDEYTTNILLNQVLKTTMYHLLRKPEVKTTQKKQLKYLLKYFSEVNYISLGEINWSKMQFHRNNKNYELLMNVCSFIIQGLLLNQEEGSYLQQTFEENFISKLYEKFVFHYYRKHFSGSYKVHSPHIQWAVSENSNVERLPLMRTDVVLENEKEVIILDTKYYESGALQSRFEDSYTHRSANLYQLYAYVNNWEETNSGKIVRGILLYAQPTDEEMVNDEYVISGNKIKILTLDLNTEWKNICNQLNTLLEEK